MQIIAEKMTEAKTSKYQLMDMGKKKSHNNKGCMRFRIRREDDQNLILAERMTMGAILKFWEVM